MNEASERTRGLRSGRSSRAGRSHAPLLAMVAGVLLMVVAGASFATGLPKGRQPNEPKSTVANLLPEVGITELTYEPSQTSGWHVHSGIHSVVVLSGALTVYDQYCQRTELGPRQSYLGGSEPHLLRNERSEPAQLAVTYVHLFKDDAGSSAAPVQDCGVR